MVTTQGFRDVIEIRRGTRNDLWDTYEETAGPYIRRRDRLRSPSASTTRPGRHAAGRGRRARTRADPRQRKVKTIAVCFINAFANPATKQRMREILLEELPDVAISTSSESHAGDLRARALLHDGRQRGAGPLVAAYVKGLAERMAPGGYSGDLLLLHSGGGVMTADAGREIRRRAWPPPASPPARSPAATSPALRASTTPSAWTWAAPAPTCRCSTAASCASPRIGTSSTATRSASPASKC